MPKTSLSEGPTAAALIVAIIVAAVLLIRHAAKLLHLYHLKRTWRRVAAERRAQRDLEAKTSLANIGPICEAQERAIYKLTAAQIAEKVSAHEVSAETVLSVFARRAHFLGLHELNAITEELYDGALHIARTLELPPLFARASSSMSNADEEEDDQNQGEFHDQGQTRWPSNSRTQPMKRILLGVPVSFKDTFDIKGTESTCGMAARCFKPAKEDALVVQLLKEAGAVPFCKTNIPQGLMSFETMNNIYGRTLNPWNLERTPGGSSGGESALLASRSSPLSVATDIGGSIRIPSTFSGHYGFKPTHGRVSTKGLSAPRKNNMNGQILVPLAVGPMAMSVHDLALVLQAWWGTNRMWELDPYVNPKHFDHEAYRHGRGGRPLRIGYIRRDQYFEPCSAVQRGVAEAAAGLQKAGHVIVETELPCTGWEIASLYYRLMGADGNLHYITQALEGEELVHVYRRLKAFADIPNWTRQAVCRLLRLAGQHRQANVAQGIRTGGANVREYWDLTVKLLEMQATFVKYMKEAKLDGLLLPISPLPAFRHNKSANLVVSLAYSFLPNLLRWPAGVCPVSFVREDEQEYIPAASLPPQQRDFLAKLAAEEMEGSAGLPVGVQLMTLYNEDELCLHIMKAVETHCPVRQHVPPGFDVSVADRS